ncbi:MAG: dTMP kinase [Epsilonproteobacteria bacterium]|nr:dTMP kinase [Campylobacterota bacterium]
MYLILEGVDTSGKSTQLELLKKTFPDAYFTKEPGGTDLGMKLRNTILFEGVQNHKTELFLFLADRAEHYYKIIKIHEDVISDRGFISGIAYALANHKDYDLHFLTQLNQFALDNRLPDFVILLETNEALIKSRLGEKNQDLIEKRGIEYLLKVQALMIEVLQTLNINYIVIDAAKSIDEIHTEIKGFIQ